QVEPVLRLPAAEGTLPVAAACRCPAAVLRDRISGETVALAEPGAEDLLDALVADAAAVAATEPGPDPAGPGGAAPGSRLVECREAPGEAGMAAGERAPAGSRGGAGVHGRLAR